MAALAMTLGLQSSARVALADGFVSAYDWQLEDDRFGGLSGLELTDNGLGLTALSDRGTLLTARIERSATDEIMQISDAVVVTLKGVGEAPLDEEQNDSEGLAVAGDGTVYASFEGPAQVMRYRAAAGSAEQLPTPREFGAMQHNSSLEALAIDANGWLYTMPERSGAAAKPFPVYRFQGQTWDQPFSIPRDGLYLLVGADFGPDGRLYVLERQFQGFLGFQSRVRRFVLTDGTVDAGEIVLETAVGQHGNQEGLSVWRDRQGQLRLTMVSDDNFRFFLRTTLVEYRIAD
jgi:hypothetical protein